MGLGPERRALVRNTSRGGKTLPRGGRLLLSCSLCCGVTAFQCSLSEKGSGPVLFRLILLASSHPTHCSHTGEPNITGIVCTVINMDLSVLIGTCLTE